jgi:hypothetical protein
MKHPGHTYGGFIPSISERGMTGKLNPIRVKGFALSQLNPDNPLTQLTWPEIRDKANPTWDKDFALPELNPT